MEIQGMSSGMSGVETSGSTQGIETKVSETQGIEQPQETTGESNRGKFRKYTRYRNKS